MGRVEIEIRSDYHSNRELYQALAPRMEGLELEKRKEESAYRGLDPTVLVALVTGGASVLVALVTHLLPLLKAEKEVPGVIRLHTASGVEIEVPEDVSQEKLAELLATLEGTEVRQILLAPK